MLLLGSSFGKMPILSLRDGLQVGRVVGHLINPHKLRVDALWCRVGGFREPFLLLLQDIREVSPRGVIINDRDVIVPPDEVVKLKSIIDLHYELLDKKVISGRMTIGKACDYAIDRENFLIQKIYATPSVWMRMKSSRLTIDRSQIVEVSHTYIRVNDSTQKSRRQLPIKKQEPAYAPSPSSAATTSE